MEMSNMATGNMGGNGLPPNVNSMQRAQQGNKNQQLWAHIVSRLSANKHLLGQGWQATFDVQQRAVLVMQMVTQLQMLQGDSPQCLIVALNFEGKIIQSVQSKEEYNQQMRTKFEEILRKRKENVQNAQAAQMGLQMRPNMGAPPNNGMTMADNDVSNQGLSVSGGQNNMGVNAQQNAAMLSHLQRPMQPSLLPPQDQPVTLNPAALQRNGLPPQMPNMVPGMAQHHPNGNMGGPIPPGQAEQQALMMMVRGMYDRMPEDARNHSRNTFLASLTEQERIDIQHRPSDVLLRALVPKARAELARRRALQQQNGNGMPMGGSQFLGGSVQQPGMTQPGGPNIDVSSILAQQANAMRQQESGDQVVPASNNVNFSAGTMPPNVNPQMLGNPNGQQGNSAQVQQLLLQKHQQQRLQQQHNANLLAQRQALQQQQQANQLRGQPGGLNAPNALNGGPAGQVNSPAMSMLNRPMAPPGQAAPGTPQPNMSQQPPPTPVNPNAQLLLQHHQQLMNQKSQGINQSSQGLPQQRPPMSQQLQSLLRDPHFQANLNNMQPAERERVMRGLMSGQRPQEAFNAPQAKIPSWMVPDSDVLGALPPGQLNGVNGMPSNIGTNVPQFNSQPPSSQQAQQQPQVNTVQMQQRLQQQQQYPQMRLRAMDLRPFPQQLLHQLGVAVPENVKVWGQLKQHIHRHQSVLPPNTNAKVQEAQGQWFEAHPEEISLGMQAIKIQLQRQQQAQQARQAQQADQQRAPGMQMPNGQAPPAQMVPPAAPMQAPNQNGNNATPQGMMPGQGSRPVPTPQPPTANEVQAYRLNIPGAASMSDEQTYQLIWQKRREHHARLLQQQRGEALKHAQMQRSQQLAQGAAGGGNQQGQRAGQPQPQRPAQVNQPGQVQGQKRTQQSSENDDVMEIPNPNAPHAQAPAMQISQSQQMNLQEGPRMNAQSAVAFSKLSPEKRAQALALWQAQRDKVETLKKVQMGLPVNNQANAPAGPPPQQPSQIPAASHSAVQKGQMLQKLQAMYAEVERQTPKGPAVMMDDESMQQARQMLVQLWGPMLRMQSTFIVASQLPGFEMRLRAAMKAKIMIGQNVADEKGTLKGHTSLGMSDLKNVEGAMHAYFKDMKVAKEKMDADRARSQQGQPPAGTLPVPAPPQAQAQGQLRAPVVAGKAQQPTQQQQQQQQAPPLNRTGSKGGHGRTGSSNGRAPPAPTDNKSFNWDSPFQVEKLKLPAYKKRRTGQQGSQEPTPVAQTGTTPGALPSPSVPGIKKQTPDQAQKPPPALLKQESEAERAMVRCSDLACERSVQGFENEELLRAHEAEEHAPIADPMEFLLESAAQALGVDRDGNVLPPPKQEKVKPAPRGASAPAAKPVVKRDARSPNVKAEVATPQMVGVAGKAPAKPTTAAAATAASEQPTTEKTLREVLEERMGFVHRTKPPPAPETNPVQPADQIFHDVLHDTLDGAEGFSSWMAELSTITDWGPLPDGSRQQDALSSSSPEPTPPSDAQSLASSRSSEISESERLRINFEWDPWDNGDTDVPEVLKMRALGLGAGREDRDQDLEMGEGDGMEKGSGKVEEGGETGKAEEVDEWDWSADERTDWNTLFGASAGLEGLDLGPGGMEMRF
ncbi:hypothetical protein LTR82_008486 [Friedmanniomyces endolithicus]|uniref:Mediator complex subunit 15 KIX domain-containing protein n=1 Tax=Friedmanniomyces endolithicus TaxID=329885 RepID=A0AAN6J844_9PEZI|nr:hypothetical protein LTR82_008486 [Friedmanniomyces endolithicus]